ncbi:PAS domain S-box protein [Lichenibacterium dinghuense]|uniref:PAS domain S-box protein n=1 Tax=Lichenibacterium dinghuense TaxID=2895977 RepID=UPI001F3D09F8|nr:PAS domain S-box protein [Lichenibacterium sp. 6Y81]
MRRALEGAIDFVVIVTDTDGRITGWNVGARNVLGWEEAEVLGRDAAFIWTPEDRGAGTPEREMRLAREKGSGADDRWHLRKDGGRIWVSGEMLPMREPDGSLSGYCKVMRDRTEAHLEAERHRESEARWHGVFENLVEGMLLGEVVRDATGRIVDWRYLDVNAAWEEMVGLPRAQALGRTVREIIPGIEDEWVEEFGRVVETGASHHFERQVGAWDRWYEGNVFRLGGDRFAVTFFNVTERIGRERRRAALLDLNDRFRDVYDPPTIHALLGEVVGRALGAGRVGYGTLAVDGDTFTVERDWAASGFPSLAGRYHMDDYGLYAADLRRGDTVVIDDVRLDVRTAANAEAMKSISVGSLVNVPVVEGGRAVAILYVNDAGPRAWTGEEVAFAREAAERTRVVIERRRAEQGLRDLAASLERQVEERTRERDRLWRLSRDLFVIADAEGEWVSVNAACMAVLGWSEAELVGRTSEWLEHPDDREQSRRVVRALSEGEALSRFDIRLRTRSGDYRWLSWTVTPSDGLLFAVGRDVTADKEQAVEQARLEEQLRQSQKMEAVGQLTGGIAHDFNNLLTGITGALDMMQRRIVQGRTVDVERYVGLAMSSANRAAALTHRLLAFSRRQTLDPRPVDGNALVSAMEDLLRRTLGEGVVLELALWPDLWQTRCDPHQLENAVLNLCINARDAMPDGGRLTVETTNASLDGRAASERDIPPGDYVAFSVSDTGTGMPPDVVAKVFEPFFTTKPIGQGTGLGLSMIHGFARQSGGQVRIHSVVGRGTTMRILLPRHRGEGEVQEESGLVEAPRAAAGETVLVIDDEATVRTLVGEVLGELGYATLEAHDGPSGLALLRSNARIDLLVTDVGLPGGMNGRQVADAARVLRPDLKVLFITGYADRAAVGNGHLDPGMHLLTKPFAMEALAVKVRDIIG